MFKRGLDGMGSKRTGGQDQNRLFDFFLPFDSMAEIVFLDSFENVPYDVVHPLFFNKTQHLIACARRDGQDCPVCDYVESFPKGTRDLPYARDMAFFSVLDLRPYEKDDGTVIPVTRKLLKASANTCKLIKREMEMSGIEELHSTLWKVSRGPSAMPKPAAVGDMYRYSRSIDLEKLAEQTGDASIMQPIPVEELSELLIRDTDKAAVVLSQYLEATNGPKADPPRKATGFAGTKLNI